MRTTWRERLARRGWEIEYTVVGGSLPDDPLLALDDGARSLAARARSQVMVAASPAKRAPSADVSYWAAVCRKILQRGSNPTNHHAAMAQLSGWAPSEELLKRAVVGRVCDGPLDPSIELHPTHEVPFWERVTEGKPWLRRFLYPQASLAALTGEDSAEKGSWVDFLFYVPWHPKAVVLEIDGAGHESSAALDGERDQLLRRRGMLVERVRGAEVHDPVSAVLGRLERSAPLWLSEAPREALRAVHGPAACARLTFALVECVERGFVEAGGPWAVELADADGLTDGLEPAALDLLALVDDLWETGVVPDLVVLNRRVWKRGPDGRFHRDASEVRVESTAEIRLETFVSPHAELTDRGKPSVVMRSALLPVDLSWGRQASLERRAVAISERGRQALHGLLGDLFGHTAFRAGQLRAIERTLLGRDSCVLLATGAGKSLIFQVAGLVRPGVTLIVAPLQSLIDDQARRLEEMGVERVVALHSGRASSAEDRRSLEEAIARGEALFVLVSPERLQSKSFRAHLVAAAARQAVNLAVVDEAHCVSEWGHDFRPSYLKLGRNLRRLCADRAGEPPPVLALTATASPRVLDEVLEGLELDRSDREVVLKSDSFDRPNLHYRVVRGRPVERRGKFTECLKEIAGKLGVEVHALAEVAGAETLGGVVFVPHANSGLELGLSTYRSAAARALGIEEAQVAVYSGKRPKDLGSPDWNREKVEQVTAFRRNEKALMVSTNAFGMGIDKPNVRYTIHVTQPGSIESFAQECGRAGRDGKPSFCYLISATDQNVDETWIDRRRSIETQFARCDIRINIGRLNDKQPPPKAQLAVATAVLDELLGEEASAVRIPRSQPSKEASRSGYGDREAADRERALYRLMMLDFVDDYTVEWGSGGYFEVQKASLDPARLRARAMEVVRRLSGGNRKHLKRVEDLGLDLLPKDLIVAALEVLIDVLSETLEPGRANALREMYLLTKIDDGETIRRKINAYLGDGPVSLILDKVVRSEATFADARRQLSETLPSSEEEWSGSAGRFLEAYAGHPFLLTVRALGETWLQAGSREEFARWLGNLVASMATFGLDEVDQTTLLQWAHQHLREMVGGTRRAWTGEIWSLLENSPSLSRLAESLEGTVLDLLAGGDCDEEEVAVVLSRRLGRAQRAAFLLVDRLTLMEEPV